METAVGLVVLTWLCEAVAGMVTQERMTKEQRLKERLLGAVDKDLRPVWNSSEAISVDLALRLYQILEVVRPSLCSPLPLLI